MNPVNNPSPQPATQPKCPGAKLLCSPEGKSHNPKCESVLHLSTASVTVQAQHFTDLGYVYSQNTDLACSKRRVSDHPHLIDSQRSRRDFLKVISDKSGEVEETGARSHPSSLTLTSLIVQEHPVSLAEYKVSLLCV